ncbi:teichoic acid ABC transporter ATP-binding protein [Bryobacterales bacterium F-183]|nr:teichoic acid ABC transporter ATP-binding protein [Bryobacterales bacterium F-183]
MPAISFQGVSKAYSVYENAGDRLKELLTFNKLRFHKDFWALRDVSFEVERGETFCIVGENGSGKSTLLQIVAGILQPSAGTVKVQGRVSALLELGSGFNPEFSGRDNVYMNGAILGLSAKEMDAKYQDILDFAEIGDFIHQPVKTYSSGMGVRLAFSVAIHVDPDILLVDEALAVGDIYFRQRCMRKVHELRARGVTILFVSHATGDVKALGDRAMWLDHGEVRDLGDTERVVSGYLAAMTSKDSAYIEHKKTEIDHGRGTIVAPEIEEHIPNVDGRHGDGRAEVLGISINDPAGNPVRMLDPGTKIVIRISARAKEELHHPNVGFMMRNHLGVDFCGTNTTREGYELQPMLPGDVVTVDFHLELPELSSSTFSFSPAIADGSLDHYAMCDWVENAIVLPMSRGENPVYGQMHLKCRVEVNSRLGAVHA